MAGGGQRQDFGNHVPAARKSSPNTEYPTPNVVDVIVIEDITKPANYRPILPGTTRANDSNLFLLGEREFETNTHEAWIRRAWTSRRHGEDSFNLALSYADKVSRAYPVFVRTYHILKSEYEALTEGTTLKSVVSIAVTSGGSGYTPDGQLALTIAGTGGGATAVCEVRDGVIVSAGMTNGGDGYTADPTATVTTPGGGAGATFTAKIQPQTAYLTEQEAEPAENIRLPHLDGQNATVNQAALFYKVIRVWRTIPGPSLASQKPDTDGMVLTTTKTLKLRSAITAGESMAALPTPADGNGIVSNGHVIFLSQTWVGVSGYLVPPIITITDTFGPGNGAAAHAVLTNGVITGVVLDAGGNSYVTATISITAPTSKLWTRTTMEVDAQSTLFAIEVVEMRQLPGAAVRSQRTEEDGIVVSVNRTLKELSTITTEESVAGGVWTKTSAEPVTALVGHQVTETRSLPGNPLPTDSWDNRRGAVQRTTQLVAAAAVDGTLTNNAGTITETSYQPVTSQVSRKIIETWVVALAPTLTSEKPDADGVLLSTARRLRLREDIHPAETVTSFGGDGSGAAATAQVTFDPATGAATVTAHGSGATLTDPTLDGDSGSGAAATATQSGGVVDPINIAAGGGGYHVPPRVIIEDTGGGTGTGATATCTISGGVVDTNSITDGGSGYSMPSVLIVPGGYGGVHLSTFSISAAGSGYTAGGPPRLQERGPIEAAAAPSSAGQPP